MVQNQSNRDRRGLTSIRGPEDFHDAVNEMGELQVADEMSAADRDYFNGLRAIIDEYKQYSMGKPRALPQKMLAYLCEVVKPMTLEALETATGIADLQEFMACHRQLTVDERRQLADYFGVSPGVFLNAPEDYSYDD